MFAPNRVFHGSIRHSVASVSKALTVIYALIPFMNEFDAMGESPLSMNDVHGAFAAICALIPSVNEFDVMGESSLLKIILYETSFKCP